MKKLFGTDGIRGIVNEFLTSELAESIGYALGEILLKECLNPKVVIGTDTRQSAEMLKSALAKGLTEKGCDVFDLGIISTPGVAYITTHIKANAGVMISASHNTFEYNGIKIFGKKGFKLSDSDEEYIEKINAEGINKKTKAENKGKITLCDALKDEYVRYIRSFAPKSFNDISLVIDCANGSAAVSAREIFNFPGLKVKFIGCEPNGTNINDACGSTHLEKLKSTVIADSADLGIAFDGDADRCLSVDSCGNEIDGDFIMAILSLMLKEKGLLNKNAVVGTVMSNYGFNKFCEEYNIDFVSTKVGDRYVLEEIEAKKYALGGEQSGHIIIRDAATTGDGQLTAVFLLSRINETQKSLSELASVMRKFPQHTLNVFATNSQKEYLVCNKKIAKILDNANKTLKNSGRILVRPSGTEPVVRIMVESSDIETTVLLCENIAKEIEKILSDIID